MGFIVTGLIKLLSRASELCFTDHMWQRTEENFVVRRVTRTLANVEASPLWAMFAVGIAVIIIVAMATGCVLAFGLGVNALISIVPLIPGWLWGTALIIGYFLFLALSAIGFLLQGAWGGISWFFANGSLLLFIAKWTCIVAGSLFALVLGCYLGYLALYSRRGRALIQQYHDWLGRTQASRETRRVLREERRAQQEIVEERDGLGVMLYRVGGFFISMFKSGWRFFFSRRVNVGDTIYKILSPLAILWALGWAIKHRMCPIVEVIDPEQLEQLRQARARGALIELIDPELLEQLRQEAEARDAEARDQAYRW